jgi:hypothetical protein
MMKMRNDDIRRITEIKQYLLDPPVSFKLHEYVIQHIHAAITVLSVYPEAENVKKFLIDLNEQLETKNIPQEELRNKLKQAGIQISRLTSK